MERIDGVAIDDREALLAGGYDPAEIGAKLADLVEETLGQRYRLRITKRENQAVSGQSESALDHILQKAKSENIEVHES